MKLIKQEADSDGIANEKGAPAFTTTLAIIDKSAGAGENRNLLKTQSQWTKWLPKLQLENDKYSLQCKLAKPRILLYFDNFRCKVFSVICTK